MTELHLNYSNIKNVNIMQLNYKNLPAPSILGPNLIYDITQFLIDKTIMTEFKYEYTKIFDFIVSSASFEITENANVNNLLDLNLYANSTALLTCRIINDGIADFWGVLDLNSSSYDRENKKYILKFNDVFKYIYDRLSKYNVIFDKNDYSLEGFLKTYLSFPLAGDEQLNINVGNLSHTFDFSGFVGAAALLQLTNMGRNNFLYECQKFYNAYIYTDGNGAINFINKLQSVKGPYYIDDDVFEEKDISDFAALPQYNSILINLPKNMLWDFSVPLSPSIILQDEFALVYNNAGDLNILQLGEDIVPVKDMKYYDLRINLNGFATAYKIFTPPTLKQIIDNYKNILIPTSISSCKIKRTDIPVMSKVSRLAYDYNIVSMKKYYHQKYSELTLLALNPTILPNPFN